MKRPVSIPTLLVLLSACCALSAPALGQHQTSTFTPIQTADGLPYRISLREYDFGAGQLPGLHSYASGRYDGKWVLTTNTDLTARELALKYKQLWQVEAIFRTMKSQLATRPIFHKRDDTIRGHVFCTFLALLLRYELEVRLQQRNWGLAWDDVIRDLDRLQEIELALEGKNYVLRTEVKGTTGKVFQACGVALPPTLRSH